MTDFPDIELSASGLDDHSDELEELSEQEIQIKFYESMATIQENHPRLVHRLAEAIAGVMFDFCVIGMVRSSSDPQIGLVAAHDTNPTIGPDLLSLVDGEEALEQRLQEATERGTFIFEPRCDGIGFSSPAVRNSRFRVHSVIVAPMQTQYGDRFGAVAVGRHATSRPYDRNERALMELIASHVAMKLETARLHRALRKSNRALSVKNEELAEAVRARDFFLSTASHELKTPLSTLALQIEIMRRTMEVDQLDERMQKNLNALDRQVGRLSNLVGQLLDVSRLVEGQLCFETEEFDLCDLLQEVAQRFEIEATRRGSTLVLRLPTSAVGEWDRFRLDQILSNLVSNAIKYGDGSTIDVALECDDDSIELSVCDGGVGIPEDARSRIFERFERVASHAKTAGGIGLGLWIVRQIVERFDGTITVDGEVDNGSTFRVVLPRRVRREFEATAEA